MTREECIVLLCQRADSLGRVPVKSDFTPDDVSRIKSKLGPWPRALEAAGLKMPSVKKQKGIKNR